MYFLQRLSLLGLAGISLLLALYGLARFAIEVGVSPARYVAQDLAVAALGLAGLYACWRLGRGLQARRETALAPTRRFKGHTLEANARPVAQLLALAFLGLVAAGCGWAVMQGHDDIRLVLCGAFFAVFFVLMVPLVRSQYRPGRPTLRLDARGVDHAWFGTVPWTAVHGLFHRQAKLKQTTIHTLVLGVSEPAKYLGRMPRIARLMAGKLRLPRQRYGAIEIGLNALDHDPFLVADAASTLRSRVRPPHIVDWHPALDEESIDVLLESSYLTSDDHGLSPEQVLARMEALAPRMKKFTDRLLGTR